MDWDEKVKSLEIARLEKKIDKLHLIQQQEIEQLKKEIKNRPTSGSLLLIGFFCWLCFVDRSQHPIFDSIRDVVCCVAGYIALVFFGLAIFLVICLSIGTIMEKIENYTNQKYNKISNTMLKLMIKLLLFVAKLVWCSFIVFLFLKLWNYIFH